MQNLTPAQIDGQLAPIYSRYATAAGAKAQALQSIANYEAARRAVPAYLTDRVAKAEATMAEANEEMAPFEAEFTRRGGWTRFFMVMNNGGHLHSSRGCSTCRWSTQFSWMPEYSGANEAEIVDLAGEDACTVCFPTAPVAQQSRLPFRVQERAEREAAAAEKATKQAAKLAKAINADGTEWRVREFGMHENFKTIRSVELAIMREMDYAVYYGAKAERTAAVELMAAKLAERTGADAAELIAGFQTKVNKKHKIK